MNHSGVENEKFSLTEKNFVKSTINLVISLVKPSQAL